MCGPSTAQTQLSSEQGSFFSQLMSSYNTNFADQQGILSSITNALTPILEAGPNQQGFSQSEMADLRGQAINSTAAQSRNAMQIAGAAQGGNTGVTTGGQQQLQAGIASAAGQSLAGQENNLNITSSELGRQNFFNAEAGLSGAASLYNPNATGAVANNAGGQAFNEATQIQNMRNQEEADMGGVLSAMTMAGASNLDTTGGSSGSEQLMNFLGGMAGLGGI